MITISTYNTLILNNFKHGCCIVSLCLYVINSVENNVSKVIFFNFSAVNDDLLVV